MTEAVVSLVPDVAQSGDPVFELEQCPKKPWCIKGAGHKGQCKMDPNQTQRAQRNLSPRSGSAAGGSPDRGATSRGAASKPSIGTGLCTFAYGSLGEALEFAGVSRDLEPALAAGRVMQFQAPLAGAQMDQILRRHVPIYRRVTTMTGESIRDDLAQLLLGPMLAAAMASAPWAREMLEPMFLPVMQSASLEVIKLRKAQERAFAEVAEHMDEAQLLAQQLLDDLLSAPERELDPNERESEHANG